MPDNQLLLGLASCQQEIGDQPGLFIRYLSILLHVGYFFLPLAAGILPGQVKVMTTGAVIGVQGTTNHQAVG